MTARSPSPVAAVSAPDVSGARIWHDLRDLVLSQDRKDEACAAAGLSFIRIKALKGLAGGPLTLRELAAVLGTDAPYATVIVEDLTTRGLVTRQVHPSDRRARLVTITAAGRRVHRTAQRILDTPPAAFASLSGDDLISLHRIVALLSTR